MFCFTIIQAIGRIHATSFPSYFHGVSHPHAHVCCPGEKVCVQAR